MRSNRLTASSGRLWFGEVCGGLLLFLWMASLFVFTRIEPIYGPLEKGPRCLVGGIWFLELGVLFFASFYRPGWSVVFRFLSAAWESGSSYTGGRWSLLLVGAIAALAGIVGILVGSGLIG